MSKINAKLTKSNAELKEIKAELVKFETKETVAVLTERFDVFSDIESMKNLREIFLPKIQEFADRVDSLDQSNIDVRECIK